MKNGQGSCCLAWQRKREFCGVAEESRRAYKERQYDRLAQLVRENLDMKKIYEIMGMDAKNTDETKQAEGELTV